MAQVQLPSGAVSGPRPGVFSYFRFNPDVHTREKPYEILVNLPPGRQRHNQEFEDCKTTVTDVRGRETDFSLDVNGFCWRKWAGPEAWRGIDAEAVKALGHDRVMSGYVAQAEEFLRSELAVSGESEVDIVKVFDYRVGG